MSDPGQVVVVDAVGAESGSPIDGGVGLPRWERGAKPDLVHQCVCWAGLPDSSNRSVHAGAAGCGVSAGAGRVSAGWVRASCVPSREGSAD